MSNKKNVKRVGLWKSESKNGNVYLSGTDKETNTKYFVFKDKKDPNIRNLAKKPSQDYEANLEFFENLSMLTKDTGEVFFTGGDFLLAENKWYYENDEDATKGGVRYMHREDGTPILNKKTGEQIEKNSHVLVINVS